MTTVSYADAVVFTANPAGTGSFVYGSPLPSWRTPEEANVDGALVDGTTYSYFAVDDPTNPTQREWGHSVYTAHGFIRSLDFEMFLNARCSFVCRRVVITQE